MLNKTTLAVIGIMLLAAGCNSGASEITQSSAAQKATQTSATQSKADELAMKQKCNEDGQKYFNDTVKPKESQAYINKNNAAVGVQYSNMWTTKTIVSDDQYTYNAKLNTCLIYYIEQEWMNNGSYLVNYYIYDIYSNKQLDDYYTVDSKSGGGSWENFSAYKNELWGE